MDLDNESTQRESEFYSLEENIMQEIKNIIVNKPTFDWLFFFTPCQCNFAISKS